MRACIYQGNEGTSLPSLRNDLQKNTKQSMQLSNLSVAHWRLNITYDVCFQYIPDE